MYLNDPKFLDRQALASNVDPDQTAPRISPFAIPFASIGGTVPHQGRTSYFEF